MARMQNTGIYRFCKTWGRAGDHRSRCAGSSNSHLAAVMQMSRPMLHSFTWSPKVYEIMAQKPLRTAKRPSFYILLEGPRKNERSPHRLGLRAESRRFAAPRALRALLAAARTHVGSCRATHGPSFICSLKPTHALTLFQVQVLSTPMDFREVLKSSVKLPRYLSRSSSV